MFGFPPNYSQLHEGHLTPAMLLTMCILYNWANWDTGRVKNVSAGGLHTWTRKAYSERTFSEALRKLELMGWITRHMKQGSHKSYPVTIHNYKVMDDAGNIQVINPMNITIYEEFPSGRRDESSGETSREHSEGASDDGSDRTILKTTLQTNLNNQSEDESQNILSKKESKQGSPPFATLTTAPSVAAPASREAQSQNASTPHQPQQRDLPQTLLEFWDGETPFELVSLLLRLTPNPTDKVIQDQLPLCQRILEFMPVEKGYESIAAERLLDYNRTHRSHKFATKEDKRLYIRSAGQYLAALESPTASLLNEYSTHDFEHCKICEDNDVLDYRPLIKELIEDERTRLVDKQNAMNMSAQDSKTRDES